MNEFFNAAGNLLVNGFVATYFNTEIPMLIICYLITALIGYALGSLNFAVIISHVKYKDDIRKYGSGNAGMTNILRTYGKGDAALTFLGDALKTAISILLGMLLVGAAHGGNYIAGFFAMLGHIYPCYFGFKGGKGVVTAATTILLLDARIFLILVTLFVIIVAIWRYISLGSIVCAMLYPMLVYASNSVVYSKTGISNPMSVIFALIIALLVIVLHRQNIERLVKGKESKISLKGKKEKSQKFSVKSDESKDTNK